MSVRCLSAEAEESLLLETATKQRILEDTADYEDLECGVVVCGVFRLVKILKLFTFNKLMINPTLGLITNASQYCCLLQMKI